MPRRRRRPSKYRFIKPLTTAAIALMILFAVHEANVVACEMVASASHHTQPCGFVLPWFVTAALGLWAIVALGLAAYQWYRDFIHLDYLTDPDER